MSTRSCCRPLRRKLIDLDLFSGGNGIETIEILNLARHDHDDNIMQSRANVPSLAMRNG